MSKSRTAHEKDADHGSIDLSCNVLTCYYAPVQGFLLQPGGRAEQGPGDKGTFIVSDCKCILCSSEHWSYRIAWVAFAVVCFQSTFLEPSMVLIPGQRANVFAGLFCVLALLAALFARRDRRVPWAWSEIGVCLVLGALGLASAAFSVDPLSAGLRVFVLLASGLGGFWCARIFLSDAHGQERFQRLCLGLLIGAVVWGLVGYFTLGRPSYIFRAHEHPVNTVLLLLWVAPLGMLARGGRIGLWVGLSVLCMSFLVICLSSKMAAMWIPLVAVGIGAALKIRRGGRIAAVCLAILVVAGALTVHFVPVKYWAKSSSVWFRAENYPFCLHIVKKHPFLGIGLCEPRKQYLEDYQIHYPGISTQQMSEMLDTNRTPENIFLTFMTDMGIPFTLLYVLSLAYLLLALFRSLQEGPAEPFMSPLVILVPILAGLLYFQVYDGLMYPQVNWFFHVLLGMIPMRGHRA
jgi:hypothetical protein